MTSFIFLKSGRPAGWHLAWSFSAEDMATKVLEGRLEPWPEEVARAYQQGGRQAVVDIFQRILNDTSTSRPNEHMKDWPQVIESCVSLADLPDV